MTSSTETGNGKALGLGRWLGLALVASLCLNLLIAGAVASSYWSVRQSGDGVRGEGGRGGGFGRFVRSLPPERRETVRRTIGDSRRSIAPLRQQARSAREDVNRVLAAPDLDRQKLAAAHLREIEAEAEVRRAISRVLVDVAATLTPEERRSLAQWREQRQGGGGRAWRRGGGRGTDYPEQK